MDVTAAVTEITNAGGTMTTIGVAILGILAIFFGFRMAKKAIGG
jgi:hypothetical protein